MMSDLQQRASALFDEARERAGLRDDPRDHYRDRLKQLRSSDPESYDELVVYFRERLLPSIVDEGVDPLNAWRAYGLEIARRTQDGRTVSIDTTGKAVPFEANDPLDRLILHLPEKNNVRALVVGLPPRLSGAQQAVHDWLVSGLQKLPNEEQKNP